jgi:ElaB/YqjD/DUF883 family membrane-anchored ribosome-binding protein
MSNHESSMAGEEMSAATHGPIEQRAAHLGRKADALSERVQTGFREKKGELSDLGHKVQGRVTAAKDRVSHSAHDGRVRVEFEVQAHPVRTLLYAAGIGVFLGLVLGRRSRR